MSLICEYCGVLDKDSKGVCQCCGAPMNTKKAKKETPKQHSGPFVNIRSQPSLNSKIVGHLKCGQKVDALDIRNNFVKIGRDRWVYSKYVTYDKIDFMPVFV